MKTKVIITTAQLKALLKRNGLSISEERAVGYTRAACDQTQGIKFDWVTTKTLPSRETKQHCFNCYAQVLDLTSVPRDKVLSGTTDYGEKQADLDVDKLADCLAAAGLPFSRDKKSPRTLTLHGFTRVYEEGFGNRTDGRNSARYRDVKRAIYPYTQED